MSATLSSVPKRITIAKLLKYGSASLAGAVIGQSSLFAGSAILGWDAMLSNVVAATVGAVPNYLINRYWTWNKRGRNHWRREVLPFWVLTLLGLLISTVLVGVADERWDTQLAVQLASIAGYGVVWVFKFFILEHLLFAPVHGPDE